MKNRLLDDINNADYVIVGIGDRFGYDWNKLSEDSRYNDLVEQIGEDGELIWIIPYLQKVVMDMNPDNRLKSGFEAIGKILEGKDYYVLTTTIDDYIYGSCLNQNRIVTPCGGFRRLQCEKACKDVLINVPSALLQYVQKLYNEEMNLDEMRDKFPECPDCGANLIFNQIGCENYIENGYLSDWTIYQKWLEMTMNKKIVMLELGVGLGFMSVIRKPFENLATYNLKSILYRVHPTLYMGTHEIAERCINIPENPIDWITGIYKES